MTVLDEAVLMKDQPGRRVLSVDTEIPTERRPFIRAFIKRQAGFEAWHMGLVASRDVTNRQMLQFAIEKGLAAPVEDMLTCPLTELERI